MPLNGFRTQVDKVAKLWVNNIVNWPLLPTGNPSNSRHPAPKGYVDSATISAITAKSGNFSIGAADKGVFFDCTGSITPTIAAAGTLGSSWQGMIRNSGTGVLTFSGTIDGVTNPKMYPGEFWRLISNGTAIYALGRERGEILLSNQVVPNGSPVSAVDFTSFITSDFDRYILRGEYVLPGTDGTDLYFQASIDALANVISTHNYLYADDVGSTQTGTSQNQVKLNRTTIGNADGEGINFEIQFFKPAGSHLIKRGKFEIDWGNTSAGPEGGQGTFGLNTSSAINSGRVKFSSGNIAQGGFSLTGFRKA